MRQPQLSHYSEAELLDMLRKSALEELRYLSNDRKEERERWIVSEFLTTQNLEFNEDELHSQDRHSKIDIEFRDAKFQIKEMLDPDVKRQGGAKAKYKSLMAAKELRDIKWPTFGYDTPPVTRIYHLVSAEALSLSLKPKYATIKSNLDLLFFVTRSYAAIIQNEEIDHEYLSSIGWRSISCLAGHQANVLFANSKAPEFLYSLQMNN